MNRASETCGTTLTYQHMCNGRGKKGSGKIFEETMPKNVANLIKKHQSTHPRSLINQTWITTKRSMSNHNMHTVESQQQKEHLESIKRKTTIMYNEA